MGRPLGAVGWSASGWVDRPASSTDRSRPQAGLHLTPRPDLSFVSSLDFEQAKQLIKDRSPIVEIVRERVPSLRQAGRLWEACCPFHQEKSPSFKVDVNRGTWHCFGACSTGGDVIEFIKRHDNVEFVDALRILGERCGVPLPEKRGAAQAKAELEPRFELLKRVEDFYRQHLRRPEGARALEYLRGRGLSDATIEAFGLGYSPASGTELVNVVTRKGLDVERLLELGLARSNERGAYDFFRGRVMFPVRDEKGRTLGFGARRLTDDDPSSPKYINTPETPVFHKGRVFYAFDQALAHVRRAQHLILVEGYTDVLASHQADLRTVVAVLGTATTEDHAALVRRSGARRISLMFDGDEAGRKATVRALSGLLPLDIPIDVVRIPGDEDPCDVLVRPAGRALIEQQLASATPWFEFLLAWVRSESGDGRYTATDTVLSLVGKLPRPIARDDHMAALAKALEVPVDSVRAQAESLPERRAERLRQRREAELRERRAAEGAGREEGDGEGRSDAARTDERAPAAALPLDPLSRRLHQSLRGIAGAALVEPELAARARDYAAWSQEPALRRILEVLGELHERTLGTFALADVFDALGDDPAREHVSSLVAHASFAESAHSLYQQEAHTVQQVALRMHRDALLREVRAGVEISPEQLRQQEDLLRQSFNRGTHV